MASKAIGLVPTKVRTLAPTPFKMIGYIVGFFALLSIYNEINFFLIKRRIVGPIKTMKGAESFSKKKGKKVALLIHGFSSSPRELRELGDFLAKNNISVHAPLLPGHGTSPERLAITKYFQWIESINDTIKKLEKEYSEIYLIGNSLGGNLALISASKSKKIKGIVTLGTPMLYRKDKLKRYVLFPILKRIKLFQKKSYNRDMTEIAKRRVSYNVIPLKSINHMLKIVSLSKKNLKEIKTPILIMQTKNDAVTNEVSGKYILDNISSKQKELVTIPESYHVFILDKYRKQANKIILDFIQK